MTFDVNSFLESSTTEANSTERQLVPAGEYTAFIEKVDARQWTSKADPSKSGITLDITWNIDDEAVKQTLGRDKVTARQGIMLDITDAGSLDTGKGRNVGLGRLRTAVNLNEPGRPFAPSMLQGRPAKITVTHRADPKDPQKMYDEVTTVTGL